MTLARIIGWWKQFWKPSACGVDDFAWLRKELAALEHPKSREQPDD